MSQWMVIDPRSFARQDASLQGEVLLADLPRVLDLLTASEGLVAYRAQGRMGPRNRPQLLLELDGVLSVRCQRCLEGIAYPLKVRSVLEFVADEEELTQEEIEDDSRDFLPASGGLDVRELIEEEIILELPTAPRHASCSLPESGRESGVTSPFAVLKSLAGKA